MSKKLISLVILSSLVAMILTPSSALASPTQTGGGCCCAVRAGGGGDLRYLGGFEVSSTELPGLLGAGLSSELEMLTSAIGLPTLLNASMIRFMSPSGELRLLIATYGAPGVRHALAKGGIPEFPIAIVGVTIEGEENPTRRGEVLLWEPGGNGLLHLAYIDEGRLILLPGLARLLQDPQRPPAPVLTKSVVGPIVYRPDYISCQRDEDCDPYCPPGYYGVCSRYCTDWDDSCLIKCGARNIGCSIVCLACLLGNWAGSLWRMHDVRGWP
ncbi:MAG: hypothetical protein QI223_08880 [Candidatus Korarchaeota archaeon]|nr:hypothetical protein [Candidatus Korarchaeota archaeon]